MRIPWQRGGKRHSMLSAFGSCGGFLFSCQGTTLLSTNIFIPVPTSTPTPSTELRYAHANSVRHGNRVKYREFQNQYVSDCPPPNTPCAVEQPFAPRFHLDPARERVGTDSIILKHTSTHSRVDTGPSQISQQRLKRFMLCDQIQLLATS